MPQQVNAQIQIENEQSLVKRQIRGQMLTKFYELEIHEKLMKKESNETKIKWIEFKIRQKSLFQNQQKSIPKFA